MSQKLDISKVDWSNPDVNKVFEHFSAQFEQSRKEKKQLEEKVRQLEEKVEQQAKEIMELKKKKHRSRKSRSYNVRKFKGYPRPENRRTAQKTGKTDMPVTRTMTADQRFCPHCGLELSEPTEEYTRMVEDMIEGRWHNTKWTVLRRYCKSCRKQCTAKIPGLLPKEHFGTTISAQVAIMRCIGISFEKIQTLIEMMYERHIDVSTLERISKKVGKLCRPLYDKMRNELRNCIIIYGDETGWFYNGKHYWVWVFITPTGVFYHIAPTRAKLVPEAILEDFDGIVVSDSHPIWNSVGDDHQKCLLHYFRDMYLTLKDNPSQEYQKFFTALHMILKDAISAWEKHGSGHVPEKTIQSLRDRIDKLAGADHDDVDCTRYAKRLKSEGKHLLTFLTEPVDYHNNVSERAVRPFSLMRKTLYGNRSEQGMRTTETMMSIYATCQMRGHNPYHFIRDFLNGSIDDIPPPKIQLPVLAKVQPQTATTALVPVEHPVQLPALAKVQTSVA